MDIPGLFQVGRGYSGTRRVCRFPIAVITVISGLTCKRGERVNRPVSDSRPHWGEWRKTHQSEANAGKK